MKRFFVLVLLFLTLLMPFTAAANGFSQSMRTKWNAMWGAGYVPACASEIVRAMDKQLLELIGELYSRKDLRIIFTVPVNVNDFTKTNALARQVTEEISNELKTKGYRVLEYRKGQEITVTPKKGEFILTRDKSKMRETTMNVELVMVGTYTVTDKNVRYNIRLMHAGSNEIIATGNGTVPVYPEIYPLLEEDVDVKIDLAPSVKTKL